MEREILFRGKREDNGEWIEGFYVCISGTKHYILTGNPVISPHNVDVEFYRVIPETVGQFTGWCDKNGVKIFEGDVIENITNHNTAVVRWYEEHAAFMLHSKLKHKVYFLYDNDFKSINVIGNIYDNPELLKGV